MPSSSSASALEELEGAARAAADRGKRHARSARKKVMDRLHRGSGQSSSSSGGDGSSSIIRNMKECHAAAKQTVELCASTIATGQSLVSCGNEINRSLAGAASDLSAESFAVIADLVAGEKSKEARGLAATMRGRSTECLSLSLRMVDALERSVAALPNVVENYVEKKARKSATEGLSPEELELAAGFDGDVTELARCADAVEHLRLATAVDAGARSFAAIEAKGRLCRRLFEIVRKYAADVLGITEAFSNRDASAVIARVRDGSIVQSVLRAIGLSKYIKEFAEGCRRVMDGIVALFEGAAGRLGALWGALARAKDAMVESLVKVVDARSLCGEAGEKAETLKRTTTSLRSVEAMKLISKSSSVDRSMDDAAGTAREVDDVIARAASEMKSAAGMVRDEYRALPSIVTDGTADDAEDETAATLGATMETIDDDIRQLESASRAIEASNPVRAAVTIHREMSNVPRHVDACRAMIERCAAFADRSRSSVDAFLGRWTLEAAASHVKEMRRLVSLAGMVEALADKIHRLMEALTTLLRAMSSKIQSVAGEVQGGRLDSVASAAAGHVAVELLDGVMGKVFGK